MVEFYWSRWLMLLHGSKVLVLVKLLVVGDFLVKLLVVGDFIS